MKIYYFGELIEENGVKVKGEVEIEQTSLNFDKTEAENKKAKSSTFHSAVEETKVGMSSIGELLKDIDLNIDVYRPLRQMQGV